MIGNLVILDCLYLSDWVDTCCGINVNGFFLCGNNIFVIVVLYGFNFFVLVIDVGLMFWLYIY